MNDIELFSGTKQKTNYISAWELVPQKDDKKKVQYLGKWIFDLEITEKNAKIILDAARARWKIENECFNSLKNHGYNIEHNYGHSCNNSCYNFYNMTLLSFLMHQIHQLTESLFQKLRLKYSRLSSLWHQVGAFINRLYFVSLELLWAFLIGEMDYEPPPG